MTILGSFSMEWWSSLEPGDQATWISSVLTALVFAMSVWATFVASRAARAAEQASGEAARLVGIEQERRDDEKRRESESKEERTWSQARQIAAHLRDRVPDGPQAIEFVNRSPRPVWDVQVQAHGERESYFQVEDLIRRYGGTITPKIAPGRWTIPQLLPTSPNAETSDIKVAPKVEGWCFNGDYDRLERSPVISQKAAELAAMSQDPGDGLAAFFAASGEPFEERRLEDVKANPGALRVLAKGCLADLETAESLELPVSRLTIEFTDDNFVRWRRAGSTLERLDDAPSD